MLHFLSSDFLFRNAIVGGLLVAVLCAVLGIYVVLRRIVLLGVALPQAGAAGIAAVFWGTSHAHGSGDRAHLYALLGSLGATFGTLLALIVAARRSRFPAEWAVGAALAVTSAATLLFVALNPTGDLEMTSLLRGELLAISDADLRVLAVAFAVTLGIFFLFRREILLASFDAEFTRTLGRDPGRYDALLYLLLGGGIALCVMNAGPLYVFGFLVLPALAALRVATGLASAFLGAALLAAVASLGGFGISYHADLPAGPVSVGLAGVLWLAASLAARLHRRRAATAALLALAVFGLGSCARRAPEPAPLPRGSLPTLAAGRPIAVLPFRNDTGQALRVPSDNPLDDAGRFLGDPYAPPPRSVPDVLQALAADELARRGYAVVPVETARQVVAEAPSDPTRAASEAARAGLSGPVLWGDLRRFTLTQTGLLLVRLDLALVDPQTGQVLWSGAARRPVPVRGALTVQEVLSDAAPSIFAEAFRSSPGSPGEDP